MIDQADLLHYILLALLAGNLAIMVSISLFKALVLYWTNNEVVFDYLDRYQNFKYKLIGKEIPYGMDEKYEYIAEEILVSMVFITGLFLFPSLLVSALASFILIPKIIYTLINKKTLS